MSIAGTDNFQRLSYLELKKITTVLTGLGNLVTRLTKMVGLIGTTLDAMKNVFGDVAKYINVNLTDSVRGMHKRLTEVWSKVDLDGSVESFEQFAKIGDTFGKKKTQKGLKLGSSFMSALSSTAVGFVMQTFGEVIQALLFPLQLINPLIKVIAGLLKQFWAPIMIELAPLINWVAQALLGLMPFFEIGGKAVVWFFKTLIQTIGKIDLQPLILAFVQVAKFLAPVVTLLFGASPGLIPGLQAVYDVMSKVVGFIYDSFNNTIGAIFGENGLISKGWNFLQSLWNNTIGLIFSKNGLIAKGWNFLTGLWDNTIGLLFGKNGFIATAFRTTLDIVKTIVNSVFINPANAVIDLINKIPGVDINSIPKLAQGGYVPPTPGGQLAVLGEGGQGEHVIRDDRMEDVINELRILQSIVASQRRDRRRTKL